MVELANDRTICVEFNMTSLVTDTMCNELFLHVDIDSACFDFTQVTMNDLERFISCSTCVFSG